MRLIPSLKKPGRFIAHISLVAVALLSWSSGCSSASATFCNAKCDCEGNCSTNVRDTCIKTGEDDERIAHEVGCGAQANAFTSCENSRSECIGGKYNSDGCSPELSKLTQCLATEGCAFGLDLVIHCL